MLDMSIPYDPSHDAYALFHRVTTTVNITQRIQHNGGRATIINGDIFYSPNSTAIVALPPPAENNSKIWRNSKTSSSREFHQPLWWSVETAYLAFFPIHPQFCGEPFGELLEFPNYFDREKRGYMLDPQILLKWKKLEFFLRRVSELLLTQSNAVPPKPIIDTALSCTGYYRAVRHFRQVVRQTRDWFSVWMAQVSYTIALAMSNNHSEVPNDFPEWCQFLLRRDFQLEGWDQVYIAGVRQSMGYFSSSVARSGIFLQIVSSPRHQFSVDWFQRFHVPVWYPWGQKEIEAAKTSRQVGRLAPPPEQLQAVSTFLSKVPENRTDNDTSTRAQADTQQKPWIAFLAERQARTQQAIDHETSQERQTRENRERNPPTRRVKVYVWEEDSDSNNGYRRVLVSQKNNDYTLDCHSDTQKVYNAVFNEWDCCEEMGEDKADSVWGSEEDDFANMDDTTAYERPGPIALSPRVSFIPSSPTSPNVLNTASGGFSIGHSSSSSQHQARPVTPSPRVLFSTPSSSSSPSALNTTSGTFSSGDASSSSQHQVPLSSSAEADYDLVYYDAFELLQDFLGFVPPLPLPTKTSSREPLSDKKLQNLLSLVGLLEQRDDCPSVLIPTDICDFLDAFNASNGLFPRTPIWDLAPGNRRYLGGCRRLQFLKMLDGEIIAKTREKLYVFDFGREATVPWLLAATSVIDALFICRLDRRLNDYQIANHLLTRGIRFRTLVRDILPPPRDLPFTLTPFRLSDYVFTSRDYDVYVREREALIRNPRIARAALMKGGIVWRLLVAMISASDVLAGPSAAISIYNYGVAFGQSNNGRHLWDDIISDEELDQICGTYHCYTGKLSPKNIA